MLSTLLSLVPVHAASDLHLIPEAAWLQVDELGTGAMKVALSASATSAQGTKASTWRPLFRKLYRQASAFPNETVRYVYKYSRLYDLAQSRATLVLSSFFEAESSPPFPTSLGFPLPLFLAISLDLHTCPDSLFFKRQVRADFRSTKVPVNDHQQVRAAASRRRLAQPEAGSR